MNSSIAIPPEGRFVASPQIHDLTGQVFGRLTVLYFGGKDRRKNTMWVCGCVCGKRTLVCAGSLQSGRTRSCGCLRNEAAARTLREKTTHGRSKTKEYRTWARIKVRCYNVHHNRYHRYGGRGIIMCDRWLHSFEAFFDDMGPRPGDDDSIERIDNDGPYSPENCRWATAKEQQNNRRTNLLLTHEGTTKTLAEWARHTGISALTLRSRLRLYNWSVRETLETPVGRQR